MKSLTAIASTTVDPASIPKRGSFNARWLLSGIVHDRRLMREAQVNIAIRWFAGYTLHEKLPIIRA